MEEFHERYGDIVATHPDDETPKMNTMQDGEMEKISPRHRKNYKKTFSELSFVDLT